MKLGLEHTAGRVPVIVTISHFSTDIVVGRARLRGTGAEHGRRQSREERMADHAAASFRST